MKETFEFTFDIDKYFADQSKLINLMSPIKMNRNNTKAVHTSVYINNTELIESNILISLDSPHLKYPKTEDDFMKDICGSIQHEMVHRAITQSGFNPQTEQDLRNEEVPVDWMVENE